MAVLRIAIASLRHRRNSFLAAFLSVWLGTGIVMAFAAMLDTAWQSGVTSADRTTLRIVATVVGGWGTIIVGSAVATTLAVITRQRASELALLRSTGATPDQVVKLIMREAAAVAGLGLLLAVPVGFGGGRILLAMLHGTSQISRHVGYRFGPAALGVGVGVGVIAALGGALVTARRAARRPVREALFEAASGGQAIGRFRFWAGVVCVGIALQNVVMSFTMVEGDKVYDVQMIASEACIFAGIGFALLAPVILDRATTLLAPVVLRLGGTAGELSLAAMRQRLQQAATPLMPIIVVISIATGTLYMQSITNSLHAKADDKATEMLNYVIVGMIIVFAAVMLVNLLVTAINERRAEFAQQRLVGATPRQLLELVGAETGVLLAVGLVFGTVGGLLTVIPFSLKTTSRLVPDAPFAIYLGVVTVVVGLTVATTLLATRRVVRDDATAVLRTAA